MTRTNAIKTFFQQDGPGSLKGRQIENREMIEFLKNDKAGFDETAAACAQALGATLDPQ